MASQTDFYNTRPEPGVDNVPIYGYACQQCGHTLDALQKIADAPLVDCPECSESGLKRQLSAPRFRLKGKGWYETDFKSDNQRNIAGDAEPTPAKDVDKSKDAKPAKEKTTDSTVDASPTKKKPDSSTSAA